MLKPHPLFLFKKKLGFYSLKELTFNGIPWPKHDINDKHVMYMQLNATGGMIPEPFEQGAEFIRSLNIRNPTDPHNW